MDWHGSQMAEKLHLRTPRFPQSFALLHPRDQSETRNHVGRLNGCTDHSQHQIVPKHKMRATTKPETGDPNQTSKDTLTQQNSDLLIRRFGRAGSSITAVRHIYIYILFFL